MLKTHRVIVSTPRVLLNALEQAYVVLARDVSLLCFDEAHHCRGSHDYHQIMSTFYHPLPSRNSGLGILTESVISPGNFVEKERPFVLGLTATPLNSKLEEALALERILDATIAGPVNYREELKTYTHSANLSCISYPSSDELATNLAALEHTVKRLNLEDDPSVQLCQRLLVDINNVSNVQNPRLREEFELTMKAHSDFVLKGLNALISHAHCLRTDIGVWAADWFVCEMVRRLQHGQEVASWAHFLGWEQQTLSYLRETFKGLVMTPTSFYPSDIIDDCTPKVGELVKSLLRHQSTCNARNERFSGLVFVEKRVTVAALAYLLRHHPDARLHLSVGYLVGSTSGNDKDKKFMELSRTLLPESQDSTLEDFRTGNKNLLICTAVAKEGIDIPTCGLVICWDRPSDFESFQQACGRARKKDSSVVLLVSESDTTNFLVKWAEREVELKGIVAAALQQPTKVSISLDADEDMDDEGYDSEQIFTIPSTGATLTMTSAVQRLSSFCSVLSKSSEGLNQPIYAFEPATSALTLDDCQPCTGPFGATVTLPRSFPNPQRFFSVGREYACKNLAKRAVAFVVVKWLYNAKMLDDRFNPLTHRLTLYDKGASLKSEVGRRASTTSVPRQFDPWTNGFAIESGWSMAEVTLGGCFSFTLFTKGVLHYWTHENGAPVLYYPGEPAPLQISVHPIAEQFADVDSRIVLARESTIRLLRFAHFTRLEKGRKDFAILLIPRISPDRGHLHSYCDWAAKYNQERDYDDLTVVNAAALGLEFGYPDDLVAIRSSFTQGKTYRFVSWQHDPISDQEETALRKRYKHLDGFSLQYPLLAVEDLPHQGNFLQPFPPNFNPSKRTKYLAPQHSAVLLATSEEISLGLLLPSFLHALESHATILSMREHLWPNMSSPLAQIPTEKLQVAMTSSSTGSPNHYQRLEQLGDTILKFAVSCQLIAEYPSWPEGFLSAAMQRVVSNVKLAERCFELNLSKYIIRNRFIPRKWRPAYTSYFQEMDVDKEMLSTKMLSDVVESLIGAAYLHGGVTLGSKCCQFFNPGDLGFPWLPIEIRIASLFPKQTISSLLPSDIAPVESILGYTFQHKLLLIEALTHPSCVNTNFNTPSYERLEFLGDAVIDMMVIPYLYSAEGKHFSPGQMSLRKSALVNASILGYFCLAAYTIPETLYPEMGDDNIPVIAPRRGDPIFLWSCMQANSWQISSEQLAAFQRFKQYYPKIQEAFERGYSFPWMELVSLQVPKYFSDLLESLVGAVFVDSGGSLEAAREVLRKIGWINILERVAGDNISVQHPVSRLGQWVAGQKSKLEYVFENVEDNDERKRVRCRVLVNGEEKSRVETAFNGKASEAEVKLAAADCAYRTLTRSKKSCAD
ncbi:hypothetical protein DL96DRAFT_1602006 [Flagelloscypha sp. PMI_526]|nr:hypothetical protein DL96DRAFT_1602006 [Flagelloscypha sp. PMI_526]